MMEKNNGKMKAAVWTKMGQIEVQEVELPQPKENEVLLKVYAAGVCITDLHVYTGAFAYGAPPHILGHEFAGEIVGCGSGVDVSAMHKRVVVETSIGCGNCDFCRRGERHLCPNGTEIGFTPHQGGYAQYVCVPAANVIELPENITYDEAGIVESVVCPFGAFYRLGVTFGETILVYGVGPAGLSFIQAAKAMGAGCVIAVGRNDEKLLVAKKFGADILINNTKEDVLQIVQQHTNGMGADTVCEAAGVPETIQQSLDVVKKSGRVIFYGIPNEKERLDFPLTTAIIKQIEMHGVVGNPAVWQPLLQAVAQGKVNLKDMITTTFSLDDIQKAFDLLKDRKKNIIKIVIHPNEQKEIL